MNHLEGEGLEVGVTGVNDGHDGDVVEATDSGAEVLGVAVEELDVRGGEHTVVLNGGLAEGGAVVGNEDHLGLAGAESLKGLLVAKSVLARLDNKLEGETGGLGLLDGGLKGKCKRRGEIWLSEQLNTSVFAFEIQPSEQPSSKIDIRT
jgi:hypothetical protein